MEEVFTPVLQPHLLSSTQLSTASWCSGVYSHIKLDGFPINLQRIAFLRYKTFELHNNWKETVMVVYADDIVWTFFPFQLVMKNI